MPHANACADKYRSEPNPLWLLFRQTALGVVVASEYCAADEPAFLETDKLQSSLLEEFRADRRSSLWTMRCHPHLCVRRCKTWPWFSRPAPGRRRIRHNSLHEQPRLTDSHCAGGQLGKFRRVELEITEPAVSAIERDQFVVATLLEDFTVYDHVDPV